MITFARNRLRQSARINRACCIEGLESRLLLTSAPATPVTWIGTSGNWNVAANWSTDQVPNSADDVTIPAGASVTVSDSETADNVTIAFGATLTVDSGEPNVGANLQIQAFGTLTNDGEVTIGPKSVVAGAFTQGFHGALTIEVAGAPASGDFGQLHSGLDLFHSELQTVVLDGYTPTPGESFDFINNSIVSGVFTFLVTQGGGSIAYAPVLGATGASLVAAIDSTPPTSTTSSTPLASKTTTFTVKWSGTDNLDGSGIKSYSVFVSDNGGTFAPFQTNTIQTSAQFTGQVGHIYRFYSIATDYAGNVQPTPAKAQSRTIIDGTIQPKPGDRHGVVIAGTDGDDTIRISESGANIIISMDGTLSSVLASSATDLFVNGGAGDDSITLAAGAPAVFVNGGGGDDTIIAKNDAADTLDGGAGADSIVGGAGNELLQGGSGNETLSGGDGADSLVGGAGADLMLGGDGADTLSAASGDSTLKGNGGGDSILGNGTGAVLEGTSSNDTLIP